MKEMEMQWILLNKLAEKSSLEKANYSVGSYISSFSCLTISYPLI